MRKIFIALLCALHFAASAQQQFTAPVPHWSGAPSGAPSTQGARVRYDQTAGKWYFWNGATWLLQPDGIAEISGLLPPMYTPTVGRSKFAINAAKELYQWTGAAWECINCGGAVEPARQILYGTGTGTDSDANFTRDAANGDVQILGSNGNLSVRTDDTSGVLTIFENNDFAAKPKLNFSGNGGTMIKVNKHTNALTRSIADFYFNLGFFDDVSSAGDNQVVNMGYNVGRGGGLIDLTKNGCALVFEGNYKNDPGEPGNPGFGFYEFQWPEVVYTDTITDQNGVRRSTGVAQNTKRRLIAGYCSNERPSYGGAWASMTDHIVLFDYKNAAQKVIWGIGENTPYTKGILFLDTARINFSKNNTPILIQRNAANSADVQLLKVDNLDRILLGGSNESSIAAYNLLNVTNTGAIWNENGRIAIGKTGNLSRLDVYSPGSEVMFWGVGGFENIGLRHRLDGSTWNVVGNTGKYFMRLNGQAPDNAFTMNSSGQVGWGTLSPGAMQHVVSSSGATAALHRWENTTGANTLYRSNATPESAITASPGDITLTNESGTGKVYVKRTGTGNTGHSELLQRADAYLPRKEVMSLIESDLTGVGSGQSIPGLLGSAVSSGSALVVTASANHPGIVALRDATTANGGYTLMTNIQALLLQGGERSTFVFQDRNTTTRATSLIRMGYMDSNATTNPTDGAYVQIQGGVLTGICRNNNAQTTTATTFPVVQNTWYSLTVDVISTSLVRFTVFSEAGAQVWTDDVTTNIPTTAGRETGFGAAAFETTTDAAADILHLDYLKCDINRILIR